MAMTFAGTVSIRAPRETVYAFLTDPQRVTRCAAEVQRIEVLDDDHFKAVVRTGVGFIKATFSMDVRWVERTPPQSATARAQGSAPGSAVDMTAVMQLAEDGDGGTVLDWKADVIVAGTLASVGARLLQGAANRITAEVFACVKRQLEQGSAADVPAIAAP